VVEGLELLRLAEQLDPTYADGQYFLAVVLHKKGDDDGAQRRLRRALRSEPSHVSANALFQKLRKAPPTP
jgi:Tfp pilus assembly protein PilF